MPPSKVQSHDTILQRDTFRPKYSRVTQYFPDGWLVQSYIRREDYLHSTISIKWEEFDDNISIYTVIPNTQAIDTFKEYINPSYMLKYNTPSPLLRIQQHTQGQPSKPNLG